MKILSIIPARGGSKGIPLKNLKIVNGKPLLDYSVCSSLNSALISRTIVSTDNQKIFNQAKKLGAEIIRRPKKLSTDKSSIETTIDHCLRYLEKKERYVPDIIILLQNTSPLRTEKHIDNAIKLFVRSKCDSVLSGFKSHSFFWLSKNGNFIPINYNPKKRPNRQQFNNQFIENGAIYITKYSAFKKSHCRISGKIRLYEMPQELSIDIDTPLDLKRARHHIKKLKHNLDMSSKRTAYRTINY